MSIKKLHSTHRSAQTRESLAIGSAAPAAKAEEASALSDFAPMEAKNGPALKGSSPAATPVAQSSNIGWSSEPLPPASALKFDAHNPDVQAFAQSQGWTLPGQKVGILRADIVYTTDGWKTTHSAPIQYLYNNSQGFLLRDVPKGSKIEYAIHAEVGVSHDGFYSYDESKDVWFNNGGGNYHADTTDASGA